MASRWASAAAVGGVFCRRKPPSCHTTLCSPLVTKCHWFSTLSSSYEPHGLSCGPLGNGHLSMVYEPHGWSCGRLLGGSRRNLQITVSPHIKERPQKNKNKKKDSTRGGGRPGYRFVDRIRVRAVGGAGGKGCLSTHKIGRKHHRKPDGGNGGRGGDVVIVADPNEQSLKWSSPHFMAQSGTHGSSQDQHGRNGKTRIIRVPCGVVVRRILNYDEVWDSENGVVVKIGHDEPEHDDDDDADYEEDADQEAQDQFESVEDNFVFGYESDHDSDYQSGFAGNEDGQTEVDEYHLVQARDKAWTDTIPLNLSREEKEQVVDASENVAEPDELVSSSFELPPTGERETVVLADLDKPGAYVLAARGARGGRGSGKFAHRTGPMPDGHFLVRRARSEPGEVAFLELELKLIADIGLVGFPNAGKSSLLSSMSRATPEIAPYPFTTLHPLVGCIEYRDGFSVRAADVPGLVAGASEGRGRGHAFLRHLERTKSLLYIVDAAGVDGRDPVQDLRTLTDELSAYGEGDMLTRPALVVANKLDLLSETERESVMLELRIVAEDAGIRFDDEILGISAGVTGEGLGLLSRAIRNVVIQSEKERTEEEQTLDRAF